MSDEKKHDRLAVYAGSFDPLTNGHLDIARRAARLFDRLIIAVYAFPAKNLLFTADERTALWHAVLAHEHLPNVHVEQFGLQLLVEYVRSVGGQVIIKGLRALNDFESEFQQALMNRKLAPDIETVCLLTDLKQLIVSSSRLKEVAQLGGNIADMAPIPVIQALQQKLSVVRERS